MTRASNGEKGEGMDRHEATARALGQLARELDGRASERDDAAAHERLLVALAARRPLRRVGRWAVAAACFVGVALTWWFNLRASRLDYEVVGPAVADERWLTVPDERSAVALRFSEGTEIELGPGSRARVAEVHAQGARVVLANGALHARVVHRPRARWSVSAGPYTIQVTGTAFDVGWPANGERLELSLYDGSVLVRGPALPNGLRVAAGQRLEANARAGTAVLSSLFESRQDAPAPPASVSQGPDRGAIEEAPSADVSDPDAQTPARDAASPRAPTSESVPRKASASWTELVSRGKFRSVLDAASARGIERSLQQASLGDLVALSDAARYSGEHALARRGLLAQRARFTASAEARAAAFVLGRMADDGGRSSEALKWYATYLVEAPHGAFVTEAMGRKLVVLARLGRAGDARQTAEAYLKRFPRGAHAAYAREVLQRP